MHKILISQFSTENSIEYCGSDIISFVLINIALHLVTFSEEWYQEKGINRKLKNLHKMKQRTVETCLVFGKLKIDYFVVEIRLDRQ